MECARLTLCYNVLLKSYPPVLPRNKPPPPVERTLKDAVEAMKEGLEVLESAKKTIGPRYVKLLAQERLACTRRIGNAYKRLFELFDPEPRGSRYLDEALKHLKECYDSSLEQEPATMESVQDRVYYGMALSQDNSKPPNEAVSILREGYRIGRSLVVGPDLTSPRGLHESPAWLMVAASALAVMLEKNPELVDGKFGDSPESDPSLDMVIEAYRTSGRKDQADNHRTQALQLSFDPCGCPWHGKVTVCVRRWGPRSLRLP